MVYKTQTVRNYLQLRKDLSTFLVKRKYQTFLLPSKNIHNLVKLLFLIKIPFHFGMPTKFGQRQSLMDSYQLVNKVYGLIKLNHYTKLLKS